MKLWEKFEFSTICTGPTITTKFYYTYNLYNAGCKIQSAELRFSNSKYFQSKNRDIFEPKSKSFFGKGLGTPKIKETNYEFHL